MDADINTGTPKAFENHLKMLTVLYILKQWQIKETIIMRHILCLRKYHMGE